VSATATWRGLGLLWRSSPWGVAGLVAAQVTEGIAPGVVLAETATLLNEVPRWSQSPAARSATVTAVVVIGAALVATRAANACVSMLASLVGYRFSAAVDALRIDAVGALPGLAHFDSPELADRLQAGEWAAQAGRLPGMVGFLLRFVVLVAATGAVASRLAWWAPMVLVATSVPATVNNWRHTHTRAALRRARVGTGRYAGYHRQLALGLQPAREVRLFGLGTWLAERQGQLWQDTTAPILADARRQLVQNLAAAGLKMAVAAVPFVFAFEQLGDHRITVGSFAAGVLALAALIPALGLLEATPGDLREQVAFLPELFDLVGLGDRDPRLDVSGTRRPPTRPVEGIRFEGVCFTYPGDDRPVLDGVDLWLPAGSSLALVGGNGEGKSTLVKLLCRFYDPDKGRITCDGVDVAEWDLTEWRRRLAVVFQDFTRLPLSAADNVGVGAVERLDDTDLLRSSATRSGADAVIADLPAGWDTVLARDFGGVDLSGGQWQRVALARALAGRLGRGASILVLDEPTAALDVRLEHDLYQRFAELTAGLTTLIVSHRFSTVRMADQVAVLDHGRIVETGSHDQLVDADGRYAELFRLQASHFNHETDPG